MKNNRIQLKTHELRGFCKAF